MQNFHHTVTLGPPRNDAIGTAYRPFRFYSADGLLLAGRLSGTLGEGPLPLVCLPGLTRNVRDFEPIARRFAAERAVVAFDFRGRGDSDWDFDPTRYTPSVEGADVVGGLAALGIGRAVFIGTSRGGIVTMLLALHRADLIAGAVLNDVGAVLERDGLLRIKAHVGDAADPPSWAEAVGRLRRSADGQFPALDDDAWMRAAHRIWRDRGGLPGRDYDPTLALGLASIGPRSEIPDLWIPFRALAGRPVLVIRGEKSDILATGTVGAMKEVLPGMAVETVPGQGHAPMLEDEPSLAAIAALIAEADSCEAIVPAPVDGALAAETAS